MLYPLATPLKNGEKGKGNGKEKGEKNGNRESIGETGKNGGSWVSEPITGNPRQIWCERAVKDEGEEGRRLKAEGKVAPLLFGGGHIVMADCTENVQVNVR